MSILIVGAGATGGYFGGRLAQAGRDVTFLVREDRAEVLRRRGLRIVSPGGPGSPGGPVSPVSPVSPGGIDVIEPKLVTAGQLADVADTVLVTVKAAGLDAVIDEIRPAIGPETTIVPVLNGMRHLAVLNAAFGRSRVLGGVAVLSTQLDDDGDIRQLNDAVSLLIGPQDRRPTPAAERARDLLSGAGFPVGLRDDILADMWYKWAFIAAAGALTCLLRGTVGEIMAAGGGDVARAVIEETSSIASAAGYPLPDREAKRTLTILTAPGSPFTSSMYRDLQQGRPVEVDTILADLIAEGRKAAVPAPLLEVATVALRIYANTAR